MGDALKWTQQQAIDLCRKIEEIAPNFGCHVALTGGTLYRSGERKDADIVLYRIRQIPEIDVTGLMTALATIGVTATDDYGWCYKALYEGRAIDFFFPEREGFEYPGGSDDDIAELCTALLDTERRQAASETSVAPAPTVKGEE